MSWMKPEMIEIKMDAEISSYQSDDYDPMKDGPLFIREEKISLEPQTDQASGTR